MKGLLQYPTQVEMQKAYQELQLSSNGVSEEQVALWSQWTRLDARLGEILVQWIAEHWKTLSAPRLNDFLREQPWPTAMGVLLDMALEFHVPQNQRALFKAWSKCVLCNFQHPFLGLFFIGTRPGGRISKSHLEFTTAFYRNWGFLGKDVLVNKRPHSRRSFLSKQQRARLLKEFITRHQEITVNQYLDFLDHLVSRRTAELDLKHSKHLTSTGYTRSKIYRVL